MVKFFKDDVRSVDDINALYSGKNMNEIMELENARKDSIRDDIDEKHETFIKHDRTKMLTVQKLIDYLKTQDPNACILAYEENSFAYIEQWPVLPNTDICTVAEDKIRMKKDLENWYKGSSGSDIEIKKELDRTYRYA